MAHNFASRTIRCAYCGTSKTVPSARGPAPLYCSPAHRQAAYRERHATTRENGLRARTFGQELKTLRTLLQRASAAASWTEARRILSEELGTIEDR
jgi:hypothetical protein